MTSEVSVEPKARVDFKGRETTGVRFSSWPSYIKTRGFPESALGKESACNAGDPSLIPGWGRSTGDRIGYPLQYSWASLVAGLVKNLPAMPETWVQSNLGLILGWEDPVEKGKATHSSIVAWRVPWAYGLEYIVHGVAKSWTRTERLSL